MTDNLRIWAAVEKTDPAHTKHVNQRGGFTAISAQYQVLAATKQFGPIGEGWGYISGTPIIVDTLVMVPVTLWHGTRENAFGPMFGCEEWKDSKGRVDSDAPKKAVTDGLTKLLSQLGFNADVFLGKFDDNKYVEQRRMEVAQEQATPMPDGEWARLVQLVEATNSNIPALLRALKITLPNDNLQLLSAADYPRAINALETKLARMAQEETNNKAKAA